MVGYTDPDGSREGFGALLVGYYGPEGKYATPAASEPASIRRQLIQLRRRLKSLAQSGPAVTLPKGVSRKGVHWIDPRLVAEVEFATWTADAPVRQASFQGLRPRGQGRQGSGLHPQSRTAVAASEPQRKKPAARSKDQTCKEGGGRRARRARDGSVMFEGVRLTHPDRVLYPGTKLTKLDVARYYAAIQARVLPEAFQSVIDIGALARCRDEDVLSKRPSETKPRRRSSGSISTAKGSRRSIPISKICLALSVWCRWASGNPSLGLARE